ncbi:uncharacterized protein LOC120694258 isoform X6 [Panicum virgatum]|nr:uncharacterized protein LOC120694258 isoform X6 [Panicum virgatum]
MVDVEEVGKMQSQMRLHAEPEDDAADLPLLALFDRASRLHALASSSALDQDGIRTGVDLLRCCDEMVSKLGLFSPNETKEDVSTANLKYLLVPYYLAEMTEKIAQEDRIPVLKASQDHLKEFIALCEVLELIPEDELELSRQKQPDTMANRRTQKVARFKRQKAAETKLQEIRERKERRGRSLRAAALSAPIETGEEDDLEDDGEEEREAWLATISLALCKAFDLLDMLKKEEEMLLAVKERKAKDGNAFAREMLDEQTKKAEAWHHNAANRVAYSKPADPITCATFAQDVIEGRASVSQAHEHKHQPLIFGPANLVGGGLTSERERMAAQVFQPSCRMPTMSIEEAGLREMKMMEKWQDRATKTMKEANSAWHNDGTSSAQEDEDAINFALLPDEALLASQLEGDRRSSIEKAYNAALREAEKIHTGRRTKPTARWPKKVMEVFQMIYMATCMTKEVRFKRGEENWVDDPIVHDMALELFARTQRAYSGQQLHNKWKNMKLDKILKEEDQKLDIEGPNLPPPASTPPPQHLGFTATANGMEIDTSQPPIVFKSQLYTLTGVPPECQKIIGKGGTLEDNGNWSDLGVKDGQKLMMIGTNAAITKVLQEEVDTLVIAAANNPSTRELSKSLQLPAIEFLLEENGHKSDLEILRKKMEHLDIENKKDKDELQQEIAILKKRQMGYINEVDLLKKQLYTAEALRSDMHNQLMELKGSIRVFCRVRPILDKSSSEDGAIYCLEKGQFVGRRVYLETSSGAIKAFTCDRVFPPGVSQNDIFVEISGLVKSAMDGKKVCIFAYGQTGSGKTFTMLGDDGDDVKGVIPRAVEEIFETIHIRESLGLAHHTVKIDMSEIYNEEVRNLSSMASNDNVVKTKTQALGALKEALSKRAVAKTSRNERSSRSHFIFRLSIYSYNEKMEMCEGALNIIDLAGSEAADSDATKEVQAEAKAINKSLLYLGTTIGQIERGAEFINFRNSQLTRELQSSLGKNCKVLMFVNVASEKTYAKETAATFEFAAQIKSSIKMETLDSKKTQLLKEKEFEFKSPGMSSVRPQKGAFGLNPPFSINIRRTTKQQPSCTKKFDVAPTCKKRCIITIEKQPFGHTLDQHLNAPVANGREVEIGSFGPLQSMYLAFV